MISKSPRWVWFSAWGLAFVAGIVNIVGLLGFRHQAITHLTGTTSLLGGALGTWNAAAAWRDAGAIGTFLLGTVVSGFMIPNSALRLGRPYGVALLLESILLGLSVPFLRAHQIYGVYCAACACGLQNAMMSTYSGAVIRTTHVSGMFTDLGLSLGHALRGAPVDRTRLKVCVIIISGFLCGGIFGAVGFVHLDYAVMWVPCGLTGAGAIAYGWYQVRVRQDRGDG
jgi:uncharacterized membrane protein YoaK (UPF0700 family)